METNSQKSNVFHTQVKDVGEVGLVRPEFHARWRPERAKQALTDQLSISARTFAFLASAVVMLAVDMLP